MTSGDQGFRYHSPLVASRPVLEKPGLVALLYSCMAPFPAVCFTLTLLTDLAYWQTSYLMWQYFSAWLLFAGLVAGVAAVIVGILALLARKSGHGWSYIGADFLVLLLAFMNSLVHARDGWTAVMPWGLFLSALTVFVILASAVLWHAASPFRRTT